GRPPAEHPVRRTPAPARPRRARLRPPDQMRISAMSFPRLHPTRLLLAAACALALAGCASSKGEPATQFDFGPAAPAAPVNSAAAANPLGALVITDVTGSSALDNERITYRLSYADPLQARTYANSRWSATPLQLLTQRLKT